MSQAQQEFWGEATLLAQAINARRAASSGPADGAGDTSTPDQDWQLGSKILRTTRLVYGYRQLFYALAGVLILLALVGAYLMARTLVKG